MELFVNDMFVSISGETCLMGQGVLTAFVRMYDCNLKCPYCDTPMTKDAYKALSLDEICEWLENQGVRHVLFTGGEPLLQLGYKEFMYIAEKVNCFVDCVSIETNGTLRPPYISSFETNVKFSIIADWKLHLEPDFEIYKYLMPSDFIKFVCFNMADVQKALLIMRDVLFNKTLARFVISLAGELVTGNYTDNIIRLCCSYKLYNVIITTQLHKLLGVK